MTYPSPKESNSEACKHLINSNELITYLKETADDLSKNGERLANDGKKESAQLDESIAIYIRECLIEELADKFDIDLT